MRSLDHPAVAPEPVIALDALAGDTVLNATALEMLATVMEVVALVGMKLLKSTPWTAQRAQRFRGRENSRCCSAANERQQQLVVALIGGA
jgi:hypothetical protein